MRECPNCGFVPERQSTVKIAEGELTKVRGKQKPISLAVKQDWYSQFLGAAGERNYEPGWAKHKFREKFGSWPHGLSEVPAAPGTEVLNFIKARQIRYFKGRNKHAA